MSTVVVILGMAVVNGRRCVRQRGSAARCKLGIDRFMSEARALTNVIGNGVATLVVAKWTGELDVVTMQRELGGDRLPEPPAAAA
jgi:Na+/H+-dicarboxylate symporter